MKKRFEETRIARHDLRQHLNLIQAYLDGENQKSLENYLAEYKKSLPTDDVRIYCNNYAIDVVVRYYANQAEANKIEFYSRLDRPSELAVTEPDTCVIFGNLLGNALEACKRQQNGKRFIRICGQIVSEKAISLTIDNSCDQKPRSAGESFLSAKREEVGTGLISVKNITEKYDGVIRFNYENGVFLASVLLNP